MTENDEKEHNNSDKEKVYNDDYKKVRNKNDIPLLNDIPALDALGYLNQCLVNLLTIHESLPSDLDTAAEIVKNEMKMNRDNNNCGCGNSNGEIHQHHSENAVISPFTPISNNNKDERNEEPENVSPLHIACKDHSTGTSSSLPASPMNSYNNEDETSIINRRRRRSSVLKNEATAVAHVLKNGHCHIFTKLRGRSQPVISVETDLELYKSTLSKRFWSKSPPNISTWKYLLRIHHYCPASTAVYLAAAVYIYRLCLVLKSIPLTPLCVHRLILAALRIASKSLEDITHAQKRYAMVGGIQPTDLYRLEIGLLFLLDFDIKVDSDSLQQVMEFGVRLDNKVTQLEREGELGPEFQKNPTKRPRISE